MGKAQVAKKTVGRPKGTNERSTVRQQTDKTVRELNEFIDKIQLRYGTPIKKICELCGENPETRYNQFTVVLKGNKGTAPRIWIEKLREEFPHLVEGAMTYKEAMERIAEEELINKEHQSAMLEVQSEYIKQAKTTREVTEQLALLLKDNSRLRKLVTEYKKKAGAYS